MLLNEAILNRVSMQKSAILAESYIQFNENTEYDLFISHSFQDKGQVRKLKYFFENLHYNVYVDWIDDSHLNRTNVTPDTAELIKHRIEQSKALAYVASPNIEMSKWCPWELGIADGLLGNVCILPIMEGNSEQYTFSGREYLGLYPYLSFNGDFSEPVICEPINNNSSLNYGLSQVVNSLSAPHSLRTWLDGDRP